jgi:hypothetical protein
VSLFGRNGETVEERDAAEQRDRRIVAARRCSAWTEIDDPAVLVQRERGYLVNAATDEAFQLYRGAAYSPSGALISNMTPLYFYVADGEVIVLERQVRPWSQIVYERERAAR